MKVSLFMTLSGLCWWSFNEFSVYASEGFDPLRYEYYARFGLPNYLMDASSYRIVGILEFIYSYLPQYGGFIIFIAVTAFLLRLVDDTIYVSSAIFSPVSFYYLSQTGKDGIAILALIATAMMAINYYKLQVNLVCIAIIGLAIFIRPPILIYIPLLIMQTRFGTRFALAISPVLIIIFNYSIDIYDATSGLDNIADDTGAGGFAQYLRIYSFGYTLTPVLVKVLLFLISPIMQPAVGIVKFLNGGSSFVLLEAASFSLLLYQIWRNRILIRFAWASLPYCIVLGATSPFYHFRYLAIAYPFIFVYALYAVRKPQPETPDNSADIRSPLSGQTTLA